MARTPLISSEDRTVPVTVQTRTHLSPGETFRIIVPIDLSLVFKGWGPFPGVRGVKNQTGAWDSAGQSRNPDLTDGSTAVERLTEYTAPHSFAYEISGFTNVLGRLVSGVRGEWTFTPDAEGTLIRWTYEFKPLPYRGWIIRRIVVPLWRRYMHHGVEDARRAAEEIAAAGLPADPAGDDYDRD
ncbi:SRPBCC family protein [Amycolatopsis rhizosphaerae]|uniref:SRPBCC family protein n=1 Tax=Amycolatopsis rhizosphaerae TaxID=2053003 RepID=A0A558DLE3_9PSEU|nr:SRPBCC family protein [Amycolatopsis rhizosphaerae]TVT61832.1 SRPBCC family protein [Amycolatopsis rhizosphaerae]